MLPSLFDVGSPPLVGLSEALGPVEGSLDDSSGALVPAVLTGAGSDDGAAAVGVLLGVNDVDVGETLGALVDRSPIAVASASRGPASALPVSTDASGWGQVNKSSQVVGFKHPWSCSPENKQTQTNALFDENSVFMMPRRLVTAASCVRK
jgi:hypothetical protein